MNEERYAASARLAMGMLRPATARLPALINSLLSMRDADAILRTILAAMIAWRIKLVLTHGFWTPFRQMTVRLPVFRHKRFLPTPSLHLHNLAHTESPHASYTAVQ